MFFPAGIHTLIICAFVYLLFLVLFSDSFWKALVRLAIIIVPMSIIEVIPTLVLIAVTRQPISILVQDEIMQFFMGFTTKVIEGVIILLLYFRKFKIGWLSDLKRDQPKYRQWLISILLCFLFVVVMNSFVSYKPNQIFIYNIILFIVYLAIIVAFWAALREGTKLEVMKYANEMINDHLSQIKEFNDVIAKERHEYKNHLNTIYGLCSLNKENMSQKIKTYINSYANNSEELYLKCESGNDFVDAILNVKYNYAKKCNIELTTEFNKQLSLANIDENIIATIIANITQNAFEALNKTQKANKQVNIRTTLVGDSFYIFITNNGPQIPQSTKNKIFELGYSTNISSNKERGFGLSIVKSHIENAGGSIKVESSEDKTEFIILLPLKQQVAQADTQEVENWV
jgi:signal transduction histidine kinase